MTQRSAFVTALWLAALSAGCSEGTRFPREPRGSATVRVGVPTRFAGFSPVETYGYYEAHFASLVYEGLTRQDRAGDIVPALARRWRVLEGGAVYRFELRSNVVFHDGTHFTAHDVVRAWTTALREPPDTVSHPWMLDAVRGALAFSHGRAEEVAGLRVVDDSTLVVELEAPLGLFPTLISLPQAAVPAAASDAERPLGSGPWRWVRGRPGDDNEFWLTRNDRYWGLRPELDSVVLRYLPLDQTLHGFEVGWVDVAIDLPAVGVARWASRSDLGFVRSPAEGLVRLVINLEEPVFQDLRVRRALTHAIDAEQLAHALGLEDVVLATGAIPPSFPGADTARPRYDFDPALARRLLTESGFPFSRTIRLWVPGEGLAEFPPAIGQLMRSYLEAAGLRVSLNRDRPTPGWVEAGEPGDLVLEVWYPDYRDTDAILFPLFHSSTAGTAGNEGGFGDAEVDRLIEEARREPDAARRAALQRRADARIYATAANVFLWFARIPAVYSLRLEGWADRPYPSRFIDLRLARSAEP
jgi:ABC-type transport system substrate-binding protein